MIPRLPLCAVAGPPAKPRHRSENSVVIGALAKSTRIMCQVFQVNLECDRVSRSAGMAMVQHKTENIYLRYAIAGAGALRGPRENRPGGDGDNCGDSGGWCINNLAQRSAPDA